MSWMRSPIYAWEDMSGFVNLWVRHSEPDVAVFDPDGYPDFYGGISMRREIFDALVLFRHAELLQNDDEMKLAKASADKLAGNIGSEAYREAKNG